MIKKSRIVQSSILVALTVALIVAVANIPDPIYTPVSDLPIAGASVKTSINIDEFKPSESQVLITATPDPIVEEIIPEITYLLDQIGYVKASKLNIRSMPTVESDKVGYLNFNDEVNYSVFNDEWLVIKNDDKYAYISKDYIGDEKVNYTSKLAYGDTRKNFESYKCLTAWYQYDLQQMAVTSDIGIRTVNGRYCIAMGSYYSHNIGQYIDVVLQNGTIIPCIIGDAKSDQHTVKNHSIGIGGDIVEFIVDVPRLNRKTQIMGDCSYATDGWNSPVVEIRLLDIDVI